MKIYMLTHAHNLGWSCGHNDEKLIGIYSSRRKALEAVEKSKKLPGFCDCPDGFFWEIIEVNKDYWLGSSLDRFRPE